MPFDFENQEQQSASENKTSDSEVTSLVPVDDFGFPTYCPDGNDSSRSSVSSPKRMPAAVLTSPGPSPKKVRGHHSRITKQLRPMPFYFPLESTSSKESGFSAKISLGPSEVPESFTRLLPTNLGTHPSGLFSSTEVSSSSSSSSSSSFFDNVTCAHCQDVKKGQNNIWLHPGIETFAIPTAIWVFDFDQTLSRLSTFGKENRHLLGCHLDEAKIGNNIRHLDELSKILAHAIAANIRLAIATRHPNMQHIQAYLNVLAKTIAPDNSYQDYFSIIVCAPEPMPLNTDFARRPRTKNKDGALQFIAEKLLLDKTKEQDVPSDKVPLILVDDEESNRPLPILAQVLQNHVDVRFYLVDKSERASSKDNCYISKLKRAVGLGSSESTETFLPALHG